MKDGIKLLMEHQRMTQQDFAGFIGISPGALSSIFSGRTKPTLNTVEAIRGKYPEINLDWLMFGTGPMFLDNESSATDNDKPSKGEELLPFDTVSPTSLDTQIPNVLPKNCSEVRTGVKYIDKPARNITEIRIFFDDQTWETFVPKK